MTATAAAHPDTQEADPPSPPRARLLWGGLGLVALFVLLGLWLASRPATPPLQGEVEAEDINVATKALARVERMLVDEGSRVRRGQVLAILSAPTIESGVAQAEALLESARALQSVAEKGPREQDVATFRANWEAARASAELARVTSARTERLYAQGVVAAQRRDEARAARDATARIARAARLQYEKLASGTRSETREIAAAQVRSAQALVSAANAMEKETRLVSPIDGEVSRRLVQPGEVVSPVLPAIQIVAIDKPWVSVNIRESDFDGMKQGRVLRGSVPALAHAYDFRVTRVAAQGSFATFRAVRQSTGYDVRAFEVRLEPVRPIDGLRPGMSVLFDWPQ